MIKKLTNYQSCPLCLSADRLPSANRLDFTLVPAPMSGTVRGFILRNYRKPWLLSWGGFTLIELLISIAVAAILLSLLTVAFNRAQKKTRDTRVKTDLKEIQKAFESFYTINSNYPTEAADLSDTDRGAPYFANDQLPADPKTGDSYNYVWDASGDFYCICSNALEVEGTGNASDQACTFVNNGNYYCVRSLQDNNL